MVNKRLTQIISDGSQIIGLCDKCKTPGAVSVSKRSKVALISTESDQRMHVECIFFFFFFLIQQFYGLLVPDLVN